jgi:alpha-D-ribose 1-methylphosphonate 5-triphosphate synthase subunit PhnH
MAASQTVYEGGLTDPVFGSQSIFRHVMDAFANPGRVVDLGGMVNPPAPLCEASAAFLAALADYDTPVCLEDRATDATAWLAFHTGAPVTSDAADAAFAVLSPRSPVAGWSRFAIGTSSYPDRSATLLLPVESLAGGRVLTLTGPGIETTVSIAPAGLPDSFVAAMSANRALFPLGFDLLLVCGSQALALPRTTRIKEA